MDTTIKNMEGNVAKEYSTISTSDKNFKGAKRIYLHLITIKPKILLDPINNIIYMTI